MGFFFAIFFFAILAVYSVVGAIALFIIIIAITLTLLLIHSVCSIFYYLIGRDAGFDQPWVAFLPGGKNYIAFTIPHREFHMGLFSTYNRRLVYWIWFGAEILIYFLSAAYIFYMIMEGVPVTDFFTSFSPNLLKENLTPVLITVIFAYLVSIYYIIRTLIHWRKNYDLIETYNYGAAAVIIPLLNIVCPLIMMFFPAFLAGHLPEYGADGYYPLEENY